VLETILMNLKTPVQYRLFFIFLSLASLSLFCAENPFFTPFDKSMATGALDKYVPELSQTNPKWALAKKLYKDNALNAAPFKHPRIPKVIHHIWLGSPYPEKYGALRDTWLANNPGWEYKLWTEEDIEALKLVNKKQYEKANYGERSDIARYEILYRFGGLYIDTDFECLHSFAIFHDCFDFYAGLGFGPEFELYNGLIGSVAGHPVLKCAIDRISAQKPGIQTDTPYTTGPIFFGQCFYDTLCSQSKAVQSRTVAFPCSYFYPWPCWERKYTEREEIEVWFKSETYAVHHWYTSWVNRRIRKS
jgi:mannosyltransferase OCH1-like enzyme